ncbi:uncharacterized protein PHALS_14379 [Plasmopara halstedii]|uniref:Uncharacterized protein n=1 Tax=Plasmopara halstedii TaxID=4781 RepID=A0A0P1ART4_PLAHL|nr:uncharacterized protein PHALS_14379 [Plasmopara halstedii]CEG44114.1 hypothetical protein PHALS_14379 [Plasmopara halstedii]|eukprot:XP_024580483.1 hypothetical protein PHALS_14379 [Plasmopara halstedii]
MKLFVFTAAFLEAAQSGSKRSNFDKCNTPTLGSTLETATFTHTNSSRYIYPPKYAMIWG